MMKYQEGEKKKQCYFLFNSSWCNHKYGDFLFGHILGAWVEVQQPLVSKEARVPKSSLQRLLDAQSMIRPFFYHIRNLMLLNNNAGKLGFYIQLCQWSCIFIHNSSVLLHSAWGKTFLVLQCYCCYRYSTKCFTGTSATTTSLSCIFLPQYLQLHFDSQKATNTVSYAHNAAYIPCLQLQCTFSPNPLDVTSSRFNIHSTGNLNFRIILSLLSLFKQPHTIWEKPQFHPLLCFL